MFVSIWNSQGIIHPLVFVRIVSLIENGGQERSGSNKIERKSGETVKSMERKSLCKFGTLTKLHIHWFSFVLPVLSRIESKKEVILNGCRKKKKETVGNQERKSWCQFGTPAKPYIHWFIFVSSVLSKMEGRKEVILNDYRKQYNETVRYKDFSFCKFCTLTKLQIPKFS